MPNLRHFLAVFLGFDNRMTIFFDFIEMLFYKYVFNDYNIQNKP